MMRGASSASVGDAIVIPLYLVDFARSFLNFEAVQI